MDIKDPSLKQKIIDLPSVKYRTATSEHVYISDIYESGFEIFNIEGKLVLYKIPLFGGEPMFDGIYEIAEVDELITYLHTLT